MTTSAAHPQAVSPARPAADLLIHGRGLGKVFKDFWSRPKVRALTDVDIQVRRGTILGLLGPNGAGKSTLMKLILGHLYPTSGQLTVFGKLPTDVESKRRLGYVPERAHLYKHLTPVETLRFFGQLLELSDAVITSRSDQLLDMVGLSGARTRMVGEFSHGMGRRLGLAQALLNDPDLLLLDEPTAGLDPLGCRDVKDLILALAARGKTVVLTSHLLADVEDVCDELLIMYGGKVQACGPSSTLLARRDRLQIVLPAPDANTLDDVRQVLNRHFDPSAVEYGAPTRTLENYFLEVVRSASQTQETHGAQMGRGVADYLRAPEAAKPAAAAPEPGPPAMPLTPGPAPEPQPVPPPEVTEERRPVPAPTSPEPETAQAPTPPEPEIETTPVLPPASAESVTQAALPPAAAPSVAAPEDWPRVEPKGAEIAPPAKHSDDDIDQDLLDSLTR